MAESEKSYDKRAAEASVTAESIPEGNLPADSYILWVGTIADSFIPWGTRPKLRDGQLRDFASSEYFLLSALGSVCARNAAFSWKVSGDDAPRTANNCQDMLLNAQYGRGWEEFVIKFSMDFYTQDSGAFVEFIRETESEKAPVIGLAALDAARCWLTGNPEQPVLYQNSEGKWKKLYWWQVQNIQEMPSPKILGTKGCHYTIQYCAVTRLLKAAQILRNITTYKEEKTGGRFSRAIHLVSGVNQQQLETSLKSHFEIADAKGLTRYVQPAIVTSVDPNAKISHEVIELASLPDGFNENDAIKNYITILALAFLTDYQDFAPLPGGNLGTSAQSEVLHMKSRGKGPALFQKVLGHLLNTMVLPKNVEFKWDEQDIEAEKAEAEVKKIRAEERAVRVQSTEITAEVARQLAVDSGDLPQEVFDAMGGQDVTQQTVVSDEEKPQEQKPVQTILKPEEQAAPVPPKPGQAPPAKGQQSPSAPQQQAVGGKGVSEEGKAPELLEPTPERLALEEEVSGQLGTILEKARRRVAERVQEEIVAPTE